MTFSLDSLDDDPEPTPDDTLMRDFISALVKALSLPPDAQDDADVHA